MVSAPSCGGIRVYAKVDGLWQDGSPIMHGRFRICCRLWPAPTLNVVMGSAAAGRGATIIAASNNPAPAAARFAFVALMLPPENPVLTGFPGQQDCRQAGPYWPRYYLERLKPRRSSRHSEARVRRSAARRKRFPFGVKTV